MRKVCLGFTLVGMLTLVGLGVYVFLAAVVSGRHHGVIFWIVSVLVLGLMLNLLREAVRLYKNHFANRFAKPS